jgi:hypothetical protein
MSPLRGPRASAALPAPTLSWSRSLPIWSCAGAFLALVFCAGCEPPWDLLETHNASDTLTAITVTSDGALFVAAENVLRADDSLDEFQTLRVIDASASAHSVGPIMGIAGGSVSEVYAFSATALLHSTGSSFSAMPVAASTLGSPLLTAWRPLSAAFVSGRLLVATAASLVESVPRILLEGTSLDGFAPVTFDDGVSHPVSFVTVMHDGAVLAGDSQDGAQSLFRRDVGSPDFLALSNLPTTGLLKAAVTTERLFFLTSGGVHAVALEDPATEIAELELGGDFEDLCAFADGRVFVVGPASLLVFPLWTLMDKQWANVNVGTRESLRAVHCSDDGHVYASGDHAVVIRQPDEQVAFPFD